MSEEQQQPQEQVPPTHECEICGENGYYNDECPKCHRPITQRRQYTLSEIRSGRAPSQTKDRPSGAPPTIVQVPGSDPTRH
jgi:hypothetical protein